jgi:hypothetical protein
MSKINEILSKQGYSIDYNLNIMINNILNNNELDISLN